MPPPHSMALPRMSWGVPRQGTPEPVVLARCTLSLGSSSAPWHKGLHPPAAKGRFLWSCPVLKVTPLDAECPGAFQRPQELRSECGGEGVQSTPFLPALVAAALSHHADGQRGQTPTATALLLRPRASVLGVAAHGCCSSAWDHNVIPKTSLRRHPKDIPARAS